MAEAETDPQASKERDHLQGDNSIFALMRGPKTDNENGDRNSDADVSVAN